MVTGASDGIGKEYALKLADMGYNVTLVARSTDKLQTVADQAQTTNPLIKTRVVSMDLSTAAPADFK